MLSLMRKYMTILIKFLETLSLNCSLNTKQEYPDSTFVREFMNCGPK